MTRLGGVPVIYSIYALPRPVFIPGLGIVCKDRASLEAALDEDFLRRCGIDPGVVGDLTVNITPEPQ